ncbi:MAG: hypothetical protein KI792_03595 [Alphaproteobacteria bacterium]|nr:hypothetical protein [Alphaproteobacteria bacterium SS10]
MSNLDTPSKVGGKPAVDAADLWTPLAPDAVAEIWPRLSQALGKRIGKQSSTRIAERPLSFLPQTGHGNGRLLRLRQGQGISRRTRYAVLLSDDTTLLIRFSPGLIADLNRLDALSLTPETLADYLQFYWQFTAHGREPRSVEELTAKQIDNGAWRVTGSWSEAGRSKPFAALIQGDGSIEFGTIQPNDPQGGIS